MRAILIREPGDERVLVLGEAPSPVLGPGDIRIRGLSKAQNRNLVLTLLEQAEAALRRTARR